MRQTTEHRSYVGTRAVLSRHGPTSASRSSCRRLGFTLVEVVVAAAILIILLIGLSGVFARGVNGFKQAQLLTLAQNLAEFQVEDIKNIPTSVLNQIVENIYVDVNYPFPVSGAPDDALPWIYDSGKVQTDFYVDAVETIDGVDSNGDPKTYVAPESVPPYAVLLGSNITIDVYGDDPDMRRYWYDGDSGGWYYFDPPLSATKVDATPPSGTKYRYRIVLQHEAFPLFSRQIRIAQYDSSADQDYDVWGTTYDAFREYQGSGLTADFEYEVTIWYKQNGVDRVLYRTSGTIGSPFSFVSGRTEDVG